MLENLHCHGKQNMGKKVMVKDKQIFAAFISKLAQYFDQGSNELGHYDATIFVIYRRENDALSSSTDESVYSNRFQPSLSQTLWLTAQIRREPHKT